MPDLKALPDATQATHRGNLEAVRNELKSIFFEREEIIDGMLAALLCRQHVLILGPPGTGKSALAECLCNAIDGASFFDWLLTKFSTPEELFGLGFPDMQSRTLPRNTADKLPEAHIAFLDEIFKANSAILNALLKIINERVFHNVGKQKCPLLTMVGASNEMPEGEELEAMFDRFIIRYWTSYLSEPTNLMAMMKAPEPVMQSSISLDELNLCIQEAQQVVISDDTDNALLVIKQRTEEQSFISSDRRWKRVRELLRAYAYVEGSDEVTEDHLDILSHALWREPKDQPTLASIIATVGNPLNVRADEVRDAAKDLMTKVPNDIPDDAEGKGDWVKQVTKIRSQIVDMEAELTDIVVKNPKRNLRKVKNALRAVGKMKDDLAQRAMSVYGV
jgi:MoxR-like ATPase